MDNRIVSCLPRHASNVTGSIFPCPIHGIVCIRKQTQLHNTIPRFFAAFRRFSLFLIVLHRSPHIFHNMVDSMYGVRYFLPKPGLRPFLCSAAVLAVIHPYQIPCTSHVFCSNIFPVLPPDTDTEPAVLFKYIVLLPVTVWGKIPGIMRPVLLRLICITIDIFLLSLHRKHSRSKYISIITQMNLIPWICPV